MFGKIFAHQTIRKYHSMIGTAFNDISIQRFQSNGDVKEVLEVPVAFGPREEWLTFLRDGSRQVKDPATSEIVEIQIVAPRMSFEMTGFNYAPDRMQSTMHELRYSNPTTGVNSQFMPVAYDFLFDLSIFTKNIEDTLQIVEQILPYFNPTINWPVLDLPQLDPTITHDIAIELTGNDFAIDYEGGAEDEDRLIIHTISLTLRGYLFRPGNARGLIKEAIVDFFDVNSFGKPPEEQFIQKKVTFAVNPGTADPDDPHTIDKTNEDFDNC